MNYDIKRNGIVVATVRPEGGQQKEVMVQDIVSITFNTPTSIQFMHGDYIEVWGETYTLNNPAEPTMHNENSFEYKLTFQAQYYALAKWKYKFYDSANVLNMDEFDLMSNASGFLDLIVANANRLSSGWTKGEVLVSDYQNLSFSGENILQALSQLAEAFDTEWRVVNKIIHLIKKVNKSGYSFSYGFNKGLRGELTRINADGSSVFSRLYVYGSDKNLPVGYRSGAKRLALPNALGYIQGPKYGSEEIEASITFEDVMPDRIGTVTSVDTIYQFSDSSIDFDVNLQVYAGLSAKVEFQTGSLAGYQFEIAKSGYNNTTKTVTFLKNEAETSFPMPSATLKPKVGDKYRFIDIQMPQTYVDAGEQKIANRGQAYFDAESAPKYTFGVVPDWFMFTRNKTRLNLGDTAHVTAFDLLLDADIRMIGFTRDLHEEFKYTNLKLSNTTIKGSPIIQEIGKEVKLDKALAQNQVYDIARARRNSTTLSEVKNFIVDPSDNKLYADMLKAASVETLYLAVGAKWTNFALKGTTFKPNVAGNPANFNVGAGQLVHYALQIDGLGFVWEMAAQNFNNLDPAKTYYVYAKVTRNALTGVWVVTDQIINVEAVSGFWHFQTGVLFTVVDGRRDYEFTHGMTFIIGDQITAGILKSLDGLNFINLTNGTANFGTTASGWDYGISVANALSLRGALIQSGSGIVVPLPSYRGAYSSSVTYYKGDTVLYNGTQWLFVNNTPIAGHTPVDDVYWDIYASVGGTGAAGSSGTAGSTSMFTQLRYAKNGSTTTPPALTITDLNTAIWSLSQPVINTGEYLWMISALKMPPDGGRNFFGTTISILGTNVSQTGHGNPGNGSTNGIYTVGQPGGGGNIRIRNIIKSNGKWTISGGMSSNQQFTAAVDICDGSPQNVFVAANTITPFSLTFDVNDVNNYQFVDISNIPQVSFSITNLKIQKGAVSDPWTPAPEDQAYQDLSSLVGSWSTPVRVSGMQGATGAALANTGNYSATKEYHGTALKVEAAFYNGLWYLTRSDAGTFTGVLPTDITKWNSIGAQFDSIATGLLLASAATIDNLTVRSVRTAEAGIKHVEINGSDNNIKIVSAGGVPLIVHDDDSAREGNYLSNAEPVTAIAPDGTVIYPADYLGRAGAQYRYATMGPGISIGVNKSADGFTTLGRKKIQTTGVVEIIDVNGNVLSSISGAGMTVVNGVAPLNRNVDYSLGTQVYHLVIQNGSIIDSVLGPGA